jgi:molybdopterin-guanine dinucleotide biosynthesis protein A
MLREAEFSSAVVVVPPHCWGLATAVCFVSQAVRDSAEKALRAGQTKLISYSFNCSSVFDEEEISNTGFSAGMFENLNTREEFERAACGLFDPVNVPIGSNNEIAAAIASILGFI